MKKLLPAIFLALSVSASAQWVRPNQFTELTTVTDSTFEVYSQRFGLPRKASLTTIKKFMDQSLSINGDSVCITKATGTTCVKLPVQAFTQRSQSWARLVVSTSYSLQPDTVAKYDYMFIQYENSVNPFARTITLPNVDSSFAGKVVDIYNWLSPTSVPKTTTISGPIGVLSGNNFAAVNTLSAIPGHYRFVCAQGVESSGFRWQLISSPAAPTVAAASSKRVNSRVINSQSVVFADTTFQNIDEFTVYAEAETGNTQLKVPVPDSSYAGKVIYYYPQKTSTHTNTITCDAVRILEISQTTSFSTTTTATSTITVPKKLTGVLYEGIYYWEMRNLYSDAPAQNTATNAYFLYYTKAIDTLKADTILKYSNINVDFNVDQNSSLYLPVPTEAMKGKVVNINVARTDNTTTNPAFVIRILGNNSNLAYYLGTGLWTVDTIQMNQIRKLSLVCDGSYWIWFYDETEKVSQNRLLGRFSSGEGQAQQIALSSDFSIANGTLTLASSGSGYNFYTTTFAGGGRIIVAYQGGVPSASGSAGNYTLSIPSNCRPISFTFSGGTADLTVGGAFNITCAWSGLPSSINTSVATAFLPAITITETNTASRIQLNNQGTGYQITHPTISAGSTTTTITGVNGIANYIIKGIF